MGERDQDSEAPAAASNVWHIKVGKRSLPVRVLRTFAAVVIGLLTEGAAVSPSNQIWKVTETSTGRVLTTIKDMYGDEPDTGAELAADLETFPPAEFATRWGFASQI